MQDLFIRFVFGKKRAEDTLSLWEGSSVTIDGSGRVKSGKEEQQQPREEELEEDGSTLGPVRIVHKEHESISAFCINQVSTNCHLKHNCRHQVELLKNFYLFSG